MNRALGILILFSLVATGCGKKLREFWDRTPSTIIVNEVKFDYLSAKAKVDFEGSKNTFSATANFRMQKDSIIWISLSPGLGVEVARVYICRDSISVVDKLNRKYMVMTYADLKKKYNYEVDFHLIESIILGNLIIPYNRERLQKGENFYSYTQNKFGVEIKSQIGMKTMKLEKLLALDTASKSTVSVRFSSFQLLEDQVIPYEILCDIQNSITPDQNVKIGIYYNKADIEKKPVKFPFNVPQKFERSEIR